MAGLFHAGTSQRYEGMFGAGADGGLEIAGSYRVNFGAEDGLQGDLLITSTMPRPKG